MQTVSRSLLLAGVLAFGGLTVGCGDTVNTTTVQPGVTDIVVTPPSASIPVGGSITLAVSVTADASTAKTVTWTTSSAGVATVDATGKVVGVAAGTATIIATSTADASKASASVITVTAVIPNNPNPSIGINTVTDVNGNPVTLNNVNGQINVTVNTSGGGLIEVFLSSACTTNAIAATDLAVASQQATSAQAGTVTLSFNTAQIAANAPRFPNGQYCVKARLTNGTSVVVATNTVPLTLNNQNVFNGTLAFVSQTGGPTSAVSSINGLNYNQGTLTATINPIIFTGAAPAVFVSGYFTRNGEMAGGGSPGVVSFTNTPVTAGVATIVFTDTSATGVNNIFQYTSLAAGDTLYITSATDASGNPVSVGTGPVAITSARGIRIDNDIPNNAGATYVVNAPNGYIGAAYTFASGTAGVAAADTRGGVPGVGGVTTTYYVGAAGSAAFATANSCNITGLTAAADPSTLGNTTATNIDAAKVVVKDALGNQVCQDVLVNTLLGTVASFGVDKIAPTLAMTTANNGAAANTGYNTAHNFSFIYNDTISGFGTTTPLKGTLTKNFFTTGTSAAGDCVIGAYNATTKTCAFATITPTSNAGTPPNVANSIDMTNGSLTPAYYLVTANVTDLAGNVSGTVTRLAAFDNVAPAIAGLTQSPAAVAAFGTATITGNATDNLDLTSSKGNLTYATAPAPFQAVAGTTFGPNFDATTVTTGAASVALINVYRGMQSTTGVTGAIQANAAVPVASLTVTDVGTNTSAPATLTIATATPATNVLTNSNTLTATPTSATPATSQTTTTLTINVGGLQSDPSFQNQPFDVINIYKLVGGELVLVNAASNPSVTIQGTVRTYTYTAAGNPLTAGVINTFYVIGRTPAGDAVISQAITVNNP